MDIIQIFDEYIYPVFLIFIINLFLINYLNVDSQKSPKINHCSWGILEVEGNITPFKDAKLYPGGSREWDWNETGTRHVPGIQPADLEELVQHGARIIILSQGFYQRLQVSPETLKWLDKKGITYQILQTEKAIKIYNQLRKDHSVGGLFHSTC